MFETLKNIGIKVDADYFDIRYEKKSETKIIFDGKELTQLTSNSTDGYVLRVLKDGGLASIAFTRFEEAEKAIKQVLENARLIAKNSQKKVVLAPVEVKKERFIPHLNQDPRKLSIDEKLELTRRYNEIPLRVKKIATTHIGYLEVSREKYFISSEGAEIAEELVTTRINGTITSRDGNLIQTVRVGIGGSDGFGRLRNQDEHFEKKTSIALQLLRAEPIPAGNYNVILNQSMAGVFTHEAFGHFSEADLIEDNPTMREKMKLNAQLGSEILNIKDDPTIPHQLGFYKYDDEGVEAKPTQLLKNGVLVGRLHSRRTATVFGEPPNGHCVAEDFRYAPIIRMGTIFIEPDRFTLDQLLEELGDGYYIIDAKGGQTSGENFTFGAQYGYVVKRGKLGSMVRDINISGNLYKTLMNISMIGNDLELCQIGGCGKGQLNIRSCNGSPHILIKDVVIGGI